MGEIALLDAVRRGDAAAVRRLLEAGADPESADARGVPALCLAIAAFDEPVASALTEGGADPQRRLPDGTTPLLRAVDCGTVSVVLAVLPALGEHLTETARAELLERARHWHEAGVVTELRRRTDAPGPHRRIRVRDGDWWTDYDEITLGGLTVRDGHAAVLSNLEQWFGRRPPIGELLARALTHPDPEHADWTETVNVLAERNDEETWAAAARLRSHHEALHRLFAADVLRGLVLRETVAGTQPAVFAPRAPEIFLPWAVEEADPAVLRLVLRALSESDSPDPRVEEVGLSFVTHPAAEVRLEAASLLQRTGGSYGRMALRALFALTRDADAGVRGHASALLGGHRGPARDIGDVRAERLGDEDQMECTPAAHGPAERDRPAVPRGENEHEGPVG
ncbi:ankyrin repeat domain-containing protein [Streptomyces sp. A0642]|uniref:ankyrin repeat domain-containing protein n=1 Tax=Streptomyces sp. A0642 TaxID=2563100 RepID=UPI0010A284DC|nr:ankyrin repeat domain-containing protein [Streptomyces sp. A0642]THA66175.1 ankyrin repeat domain-containing protein [Streptomyces sp. A0642]